MDLLQLSCPAHPQQGMEKPSPAGKTPKGFAERKGQSPALLPAAAWGQAEAVTDDLSRELLSLHHFLH